MDEAHGKNEGVYPKGEVLHVEKNAYVRYNGDRTALSHWLRATRTVTSLMKSNFSVITVVKILSVFFGSQCTVNASVKLLNWKSYEMVKDSNTSVAPLIRSRLTALYVEVLIH